MHPYMPLSGGKKGDTASDPKEATINAEFDGSVISRSCLVK